MLPILVLLVSQINPYGEAQAQIIVPSAGAKFVTGLGGAALAGGMNVGDSRLEASLDPSLAVQPQVDLYRTTQGGLIDDYRLAEALINRTAAQRAEALRLMAAAQGIELQNARLREYLCTRFCSAPGVGINPLPAIPPTPMFPTIDNQLPADLYPTPLPYVPPPRDDFNARYYIRHGGTVQVQVLPNVPVYRRRY